MSKSRDAFRTISEVAELLDTPAHVLRFWESKFTQVKPVKRAGGRRYYRPGDIGLLAGIKHLLHEEGMTIKGVQKVLREQGVKHVASLTEPMPDEEIIEDAPFIEVIPESATVLPFAPVTEQTQFSFDDSVASVAEEPVEPESEAPAAEPLPEADEPEEIPTEEPEFAEPEVAEPETADLPPAQPVTGETAFDPLPEPEVEVEVMAELEIEEIAFEPEPVAEEASEESPAEDVMQPEAEDLPPLAEAAFEAEEPIEELSGEPPVSDPPFEAYAEDAPFEAPANPAFDEPEAPETFAERPEDEIPEPAEPEEVFSEGPFEVAVEEAEPVGALTDEPFGTAFADMPESASVSETPEETDLAPEEPAEIFAEDADSSAGDAPALADPEIEPEAESLPDFLTHSFEERVQESEDPIVAEESQPAEGVDVTEPEVPELPDAPLAEISAPAILQPGALARLMQIERIPPQIAARLAEHAGAIRALIAEREGRPEQ